ncbi:glycerate kinase, partial [Bacillus altitudinis]|uniref:glycerate kinase n=1 Tax=Bacillus altitudinis TaxID=293387 RepID=UPI001643B23A
NLCDFGEVGKEDVDVWFGDGGGGGGGGGVGGSLLGFLEGDVEKGIDIVVKGVDFGEVVKDGEVVSRGEGGIDEERI